MIGETEYVFRAKIHSKLAYLSAKIRTNIEDQFKEVQIGYRNWLAPVFQIILYALKFG